MDTSPLSVLGTAELIGGDQLLNLASLLPRWQADEAPAGLFALVAEASAHHVPALQALCQDNHIPLVGAVFPGLVTESGFLPEGMILIRLTTVPPLCLVDNLHVDTDAAVAHILHQAQPTLTAARESHSTVFWIFDGLLPHIGSVLIEVGVASDNALRFTGVNAGSERFSSIPCLFDAHRFIANGAICLALPPATRQALGHSYPTSQRSMRASSAEGNRIDKIDGRPALDVYRDVVHAEYGVDIDRSNFYELAVHFPFGVISVLEVLVRIPVAFHDDGSIVCVGEIPPNSVLKLLRAPALADSKCVDQLSSSLSPHHHAPLAFYCAGRRMHFGPDAVEEVTALSRVLNETPIRGALTLGEIGTVATMGLQIPQFHNACVLCLA